MDDSKRAGDIDLYVETSRRQTLLSELRCKIALEERLHLSVDLVVNEPSKEKTIYNLAKSQEILL